MGIVANQNKIKSMVISKLLEVIQITCYYSGSWGYKTIELVMNPKVNNYMCTYLEGYYKAKHGGFFCMGLVFP